MAYWRDSQKGSHGLWPRSWPLVMGAMALLAGCGSGGNAPAPAPDEAEPEPWRFTPRELVLRGDSGTVTLSKSSGVAAAIDFGEQATGIDILPTNCQSGLATCEQWDVSHRPSTATGSYFVPTFPLGDDRSSPASATLLVDVVPVLDGGNSLPGVRAVWVGENHSFLIDTGGEIWAWGDNSSGQLGLGFASSEDFERTVPIRTDLVSTGQIPAPVASIATGAGHSLALLADGTVWAWGANDSGQLGDGSQAERRRPVAVDGLANVIAIAAAEQYSLALRADGAVMAWGANSNDVLGTPLPAFRDTPAQVPGIGDVQAIAAGSGHVLALKSDGTVWAWGANSSGQLGDGSETPRTEPAQVPGLSSVRAIAVGERFSLALGSDGAVWAWGENDDGQLGNGTTAHSPSPARVQGLAAVEEIDAGLFHAVARLADGRIFGWGDNLAGQLAGGSSNGNIEYPTPVELTDMGQTLAIDAGGRVTATITADCGDDAGTLRQAGSPTRLGYGLVNASASIRPAPVFGSGSSGQCGAVFAQIYVAGSGDGEVTSDRGAVQCSSTRTPRYCWVELPAASAGSTLGLTATPDSQSNFAGWRWDCMSDTSQTTLTVAPAMTCKVMFDRLQATTPPVGPSSLSVTVEGAGRVTSTPAGIDCGADCSASFPRGSSVSLTATPDSGYAFAGWRGDCSQAGSGGSANVTMDVDRQCSAVFTASTSGDYLLTVSATAGGRIDSSNPGIACGADCTERYPAGAMVVLIAMPDQGYEFVSWSGDCQYIDGVGPYVSATMDSDKQCDASFAPVTSHSLTVGVIGAGRITSTPAGIDCNPDCTEDYPAGAAIMLTAIPTSPFVFSRWMGNCTSTTPQTTIAMNADLSCTAVFAQPTMPVVLTLQIEGATVDVFEPVAGFLCSRSDTTSFATTCTATYETGTDIILQVNGLSANGITAWSNCDGLVTVQPRVQHCGLRMSADRTVILSVN